MRRLIAVGFALVAGLWLAVPATAATATLHVAPSSVAAGNSVKVSGTCEANTSGYAISHAFLHDPGHDFAGVGAVAFQTDASGAFSAIARVPTSITAGNYPVTGRCGGGNLGSSVTLTVTAASSGGLPTAVPAGSGGQAATTSAGTVRTQLVAAAAGLALLVAGGLGARRLRRSNRPAH